MISLTVYTNEEGSKVKRSSLKLSSSWQLLISGKASKELSSALTEFFAKYQKKESPLFPWELLEHPIYSPFRLECLLKMHQIPFGETLTYSELAEKSGSPRAARAVGSCCSKNLFPLFLPCHRVLGVAGCGKYSEGDEIKPLLLKQEGAL